MFTEYPLLDLQSIPSLVSSTNHATFIAQISPVIAKKILEEFNYDRQRVISTSKIKQLVSAMKEDLFEPFTTTINFCIDSDGKMVLVDGQHRLSSMVELDKGYTVPLLVTRNNPDYIYPKTDRGRPRSIRDGIRSMQIDTVMGLSFTATTQIATAVRLIEEGYRVAGRGRVLMNDDTLLETMTVNYTQVARRLYEMTNQLEYASKLHGRLPCSLLLTLYMKLPKEKWGKIDEFIYGCASNIGLQEGDPRRLVYVMYTRYNRTGAGVQKATMQKAEEIGILLTSWLYWYSGRTHKRQFSTQEIRKVLANHPNVAGTNVTYRINLFK